MGKRGRVLFQDRRVSIVLGVGAFLAGWALLYDAYDRRGINAPAPIKVISWW